MIVHYFDPKIMAYTACKKLPFGVETTDDVSRMTCERCKEILNRKEKQMNKKKYITDFRLGTCDKCEGAVPKHNSAVLLQEIATGGFAGFVMDRHLYPTDDCEGSPSRVRLIETDAVWTDAYALITEKESDD